MNADFFILTGNDTIRRVHDFGASMPIKLLVFPCNSFCLAGCSQPVLAGSSPSISSVHCGRGMHIKSTLKHQFEQVFFRMLTVLCLFCHFCSSFSIKYGFGTQLL